MVPLHASIHSYLDQILDLLDEGICITDVTGVILYLNKRYEEISSIPREIMLGKKAQDFVHQGMLNIVVNPEVIQTHEIVTRVQNTSTGRFLLLEGHPVFDESGRPVMCLTFVRDESCMINQQATLMRQKEIIETFSRMEFEHGSPENGNLEIVQSTVMRNLYKKISRIASSEVPVLVLGETGTGKDVIARRIHHLSRRKKGPFIKVDCGCIAPSLIESELFGYEGGAFSGALHKGKMGLIEAASHGTLFLDEIGELPLAMQTRLLRVLQDGEILRIGSIVPKKVDVRIVAATNRKLDQAVRRGDFRSDLYYRLKFIALELPPLRERTSEIIPMAHAFLDYYSKKYHRELQFTGAADKALAAYSWPGNVRELRNMIHGLSVYIDGKTIDVDDLPLADTETPHDAAPAEERPQTPPPSSQDYKTAMDAHERKLLDEVLSSCPSVTDAARRLGMDRSTLFRKIKGWRARGVMLGKRHFDLAEESE